jgi:hypothetical protein
MKLGFKHRLITIFFTLFYLSSSVNGQTITEDLVAMGKKFNGLKSYDMTVVVKIYSQEPNSKVTFNSTGRTAKLGDKFYLNMLGRKTIINNKIMLLVDDKQKLLLYNNITDDELKAINNPQNLNIDSIVKSQKTVAKYLVNNNTEKKIQIETGNDEIKTIIMSFNTITFAINEIVYFYSESVKKGTGNSKVVITYSNFSVVCKSPELFDQSKYIHINGETVTAQGTYKNYKLIKPEGFKNE